LAERYLSGSISPKLTPRELFSGLRLAIRSANA
jgi:hypothetical protein